jgi:two-component system, NarL family, nitrate/nitrite response regulator NarL
MASGSGEQPAALAARGVTVAKRDGLRLAIQCATTLYRHAVAEALEKRGGFKVIADSQDVEDLAVPHREGAPHVVLLDASEGDATRVARTLQATLPRAYLVAISVRGDEDVVALAEAGVSGYLPRGSSIDDLIGVLASVAHTDELSMTHIAAVLSQRLSELSRTTSSDLPPSLTPREAQVVASIEQGLSNKAIARRLGVELQTVKNHVHNVLVKLDVSSRGEIGAWARRNVFIPSERGLSGFGTR